MGKKLDKLAARVLALEEAIAAMLSGKRKVEKSATKKKSKKTKPAKASTKASAPKKAKRRVRKTKPAPVIPPAPIVGTL